MQIQWPEVAPNSWKCQFDFNLVANNRHQQATAPSCFLDSSSTFWVNNNRNFWAPKQPNSTMPLATFIFRIMVKLFS